MWWITSFWEYQVFRHQPKIQLHTQRSMNGRFFCDKKLRTYQEQQFFFKTYYLWRWMCTLIRNDILILCYQWYISTINYLHNNKFNDSCFASIFPIPAFKDWFLQICFFYALFINISNFNVHVLGSLMGN